MITLDIENLAYGGDSVAHLPDGRAAFISGGCPGDRVNAEIIEERERFVRGRVVEILSASPDRVSAPCPYFGVCGGCDWQHVSYARQLEAKRQALVDAFTRIGRIDNAESLVAPTLASPHEYGYRNKIELVADSSSGKLVLGYHRANSHEIVPVELCLLVPKRFQKAPKALAGALRYASGTSDLGIERVQLRVARNTKDVEVGLWTQPSAFPRAGVAKILGQSIQMSSLVRVLHKGPIKQRAVSGVEVLSGKGHWRERLSGIDYGVSAPSFFQVNTPLAEQLVRLVLDAVDPDGTDRVLDLYAGAGTFTLHLAERAGDVVAVEAYGPAVRDLRRNLENHQVWADVIGGDAAREIAALGHFDAAVLDPPRSGLASEVISAIGAAKPRVLAYVSCDPATLARDAKSLAEVGYALTEATPVDLFPQTYHVETVARFERA